MMKNNFTIRKQYLLTLFIGLINLSAFSQAFYPVVARFTQLPPYPVYLADFSNPSQTNLSIQVQQNDATIATRPIRIRIYIEGQGFLIQSTDLVQGEPPLTLAVGQVYNLPADQVANYFKQYNLKVSPDQYRRPFSEGSFRFGVEIIDFQTNRPLSGIQWANPVWITINEPPVWVIPQNSVQLIPTTPQNITFQWAPRHTNVNDVEYEFTITDLMVNKGFNGNVQNLFLAQPSYFKTRTRVTTLNYNATMPPLVPGRTYAYRVEAIAKRGREDVGVFRNNGYSEIQSLVYGEPIPDVKPPTNLRITRNETNTGANFDWKGEPDHKNFIVEYREQGSKENWATANVKAGAGNVYNSFNIPKLDEKKGYEIRVAGVNEANKSAYSTPISLAAVTNTLKKEPEIAIQGTVQWAYYAGEENIKTPGNIIEPAESTTTPPRNLTNNNFEEEKAGAKKYLLEKAIVTLFSSDDANINTTNFREKFSSIKRIETVSSDANGKYEFKAANIKLLADVKNLYVLATYYGVVFKGVIQKIPISANESETKIIEPITILANSMRFSPKILLEQTAGITNKIVNQQKFVPFKMITEEVRVPVSGLVPIEGTLTTENAEDIGLYRLQSIIDKNPYLKDEGNIEGNKPTIKYNNDTYVKVADFKNTTTSAQLFYNKAYNDSFVFRIKQKERDEVIYPVDNIEAFQEAKYAQVTDYFKYKPSTFKLKGYVERKGKTKMDRLANVAVQAMGTTFRTDAKGYFEAEIPLTLAKDTKIILSAVDPLNAANKSADTTTYNLSNITRTLVFKEGAHYVSSVVYDTYTRKPLGGAMVTYKGSTVKTDSSGRFRFVSDGDQMDDKVTALAAGYTEQKVEPKDFKSTSISGGSNAEKKIDWLKNLETDEKSNAPKESLQKERGEFFDANFTKLERIPSGNFIKDSVLLNSEIKYRILTYTEKRSKSGVRNLADSANYMASVLTINGVEKEVPIGGFSNGKDRAKGHFGGLIDKTTAKTLKVQVVNKDSTKQQYADGEMSINIPTKTKKDSIYTFTFRLRPTKYLYGIVYDSTMFIKGVHKDDDKTVNRPGEDFIKLEGATVSVEHGGSTVSDKNGFFKLLVPVGQELAMEVTKKGYAKTMTTLNNWDSESYKASDDKKTRRPFYIVQTDTLNIPSFKTLLGFDVVIDKSVINSNAGGTKTFLISGKILLNKGKLAKSANIFTADKTKELTFKNLVVKSQDEAENKNNAVTLLNSVNLVETEAEIKLFDYAPITLKGNHAGEPFIRLNHLLGKPGEGKIGASELEFTQKTMMGIKFGEMELKIKEPEKDKAVLKANDKVSKDKEKSELYKDQTKLEKELATKKDNDKTAKTATQKEAAENAKATLVAAKDVQKAIGKSGTADDKKTASEVVADKKKALADAKYDADGATKVPEKEPLALAFATSELEELKDDKEFSIEFRKKAKEGEDKIKFTLGSANLSSLGVGNVTTSAPGVSAISVLIDPSSAVLKKSGVGMKGDITFPQIWKFKTDKPLIIDKLDIDKQFGLKQVNFMKGDKGDIYSFGMADKWMFFITNFQIYNNFKGYGIGGTFNTDKDNFLNVKSLGLSVSGGKVYPNVEITTPEQGIRFSKLRFKTMGKKTISFKGVQGKTLEEDGYEVEASLRIEYDDSELTSTALTSTTDRNGRLTPSIVEANKVEAEIEVKEKALVKEKQGLDESYAKALDKQSKAKTASEKAKIRAEIVKLDEKRSGWLGQVKNWEDVDKKAKTDKIDKLKEDANKQFKADSAEIAKKEGVKKEETKKKATADSVAVAKTGQPVKKDEKGLNWKDRLFPINLQVFQWSTAGKLLVSAAPSEKALDFGVVNVKIRRIVFTKASNPKAQVKLSEINDLLKLTEDEAAKLSSTTNFNDANMALADGKRQGVFDKDEQKKREAVSSGGLTVKVLSDKVAAEDPNASWALGFAGGIELTSTLKGLKFDSDLSMIVGDFGNGTEFKINEIMLKLDGTGYRVMGKVKLATSGKKIGFEGAVDFETVKRKFAASFKYYKVDGGIELGAAIQVSAMIPMSSITWTSIGGGFDLNTADQKYKVFFLGSAVTTGTPEKVATYKNVNVSVEFDGKTCGGVPVIKGSMELWTNDEEFCKASVEIDFCKLRVIAKVSCLKELAKTMVQMDALVVVSKAGFFAGAMVRAEVLGFTANGMVAIGVACNTSSPDMPIELADYKRKLPDYLFQSDKVTFSGIYIGFELGKEVKDEGKFSVGPISLASYAIELKIKGAASLGVNFANRNALIKSELDMSVDAKVSVLSFNINGSLRLVLKLEGGYTDDMGWNFLAQTYGNLSVYNEGGSGLACDDWKAVYDYEWQTVCASRKVFGWWPGQCQREERRWVRKAWIIPDSFVFKRCYNWNFGVRYRGLGPEQGWKFMR